MSLEMVIWRVDTEVTQLATAHFSTEAKLEEILEKEINILGLDLLLIGRQVPTAFSKVVDLLAINSQGDLYVIEVKRDRTPRDVVAQILDYASWVKGLTHKDVLSVYSSYSSSQGLEQAFIDRFGKGLPKALNRNHHLVIVATELDSSTQRIVSYLASYGISVNTVSFQFFKDGSREYLARIWSIDPKDFDAIASNSFTRKYGRETWNGQELPPGAWREYTRKGGRVWYARDRWRGADGTKHVRWRHDLPPLRTDEEYRAWKMGQAAKRFEKKSTV